MPSVGTYVANGMSDMLFQWTAAGVNVYVLQGSFAGPKVNMTGNRVAGVLAYQQGGEEQLMATTFSGGLGHPEDTEMVLGPEWVKNVKHLAKIMGLSVGSIFDGPKNRGHAGRWHCSHCEKKLAAFAVSTLLARIGQLPEEFDEVSLYDLEKVRRHDWGVGNEPRLGIHITRSPCQLCVKFVRYLAAFMNVDLSIRVGGLLRAVEPDQFPGRRVPELANHDEDKDDLEFDQDNAADVPVELREGLLAALNAANPRNVLSRTPEELREKSWAAQTPEVEEEEDDAGDPTAHQQIPLIPSSSTVRDDSEDPAYRRQGVDPRLLFDPPFPTTPTTPSTEYSDDDEDVDDDHGDYPPSDSDPEEISEEEFRATSVIQPEDCDIPLPSIEFDEEVEDLGERLVENSDESEDSEDEDTEDAPTPEPAPAVVSSRIRQQIRNHGYTGPVLLRQQTPYPKPRPSPLFSTPSCVRGRFK